MADLLGVAAEGILNKIVSVAAEEINLARGFEGELKRLKDKSSFILDLLRDAEQRPVRREGKKLWIKNLKNAAYEADDVLDEFAYEMLRRKLEIQNRMKNKFRNFFSVSNPIAFRFKMARKIQDVKVLLDRVVEEGSKLGLHPSGESPVSVTANKEIRLTQPFIKTSKVLGRKDDALKVVDMLCKFESEEDFSVVTIVGMAGLGKTTLAQKVYEDEKVTKYFDKSIWVCISDDFEVKRILKEIGESISVKVGEMSNIEAMVKMLKEKLQGKKCLLVFDDVWNTDSSKWDLLKNSLLGIEAAKESKILATTRSNEVVSTMQTLRTHRLKCLSDDDSWALFRERAFAIGALAQETTYLSSIGRRMVQRCGGVPLAIMTLGALMHSKKGDQWSSIEGKIELWDLSNDKSGIMPALRLSFDHLPSSWLKRCFAYCAVFPKDFVFDKDNLVRLWMAQGFIQPQESDSEPEDTGNDYFMILLWNSFFQDVELDECGIIRSCKMHDLVHDLAQSISKSECLALDSNKVVDNFEVRHLYLATNQEGIRQIPKENAMILHTLYSASYANSDFLMGFKRLRSLNLQGSLTEKLCTSIGNMKHLRYLNLSNTHIVKLPTSICKLYHLQTLRLNKCHSLEELPKELTKLISLRHLCFDQDDYSPFDPYKVKMPAKLGQLTSLQTLSYYVVGQDNGQRIEELGSLCKLRGNLSIYGLEHVKDGEEAKRSKLIAKINVYKLKLAWGNIRGGGGDNNNEDVLEGLQPPPSLKSLVIENFSGSKFPSWMMRNDINSNGNLVLLQNLVTIKLINCNYCNQVPTLGELPSLRFLEIRGMKEVKCIDQEFYSYGSDCGPSTSTSVRSSANPATHSLFPKLENFILSHMWNLVEWRNAIGATRKTDEDADIVVVFPCLQELSILSCKKLMTAPTHFSSLRHLEIGGVNSEEVIANICSNVASLEFLRMEISGITCPSDEWLLKNKQLIQLEVSFCDKLTSIPSVQGLTRLGKLVIRWCHEIIELPSGLGSCTSLSYLSISYCANLKSLQLEEFLPCLTCLEELRLGPFCEDLDFFPFSVSTHHIQQLPQLKKLELYGWEKLKSLPNHLQYLTSLQSLRISYFNEVVAPPEWLGNLSSLQRMEIFNCSNLEYLPSEEAMRRLNKLTNLAIVNCPLLKERCRKGSGPEWFKISHIRDLKII